MRSMLTGAGAAAVALGLCLPGAFAQSVEDCRARIVEVQSIIDARPDKDSDETKHASEQLMLAENEAARGDAEKCMEVVQEAREAAGR